MAEETPPSSSLDVVGIGELSKVGRDLIQIFAKRWIEPGTIRALAHANADAYRIGEIAKTEVEIEKRKLLERATVRMANEAIAQQENVEKVVTAAAHLLKDSGENPVDPNNIDPDWTAAFTRHIGEVSNEEMQKLWSQILTGEASKPGSFGKRTMNLVAELSKEEAQMFEVLCRYSIQIGPVIFDLEGEIYAKNNINFDFVSTLQNAGLIDVIHNGEYVRTQVPKFFPVTYSNRLMIIPKTDGTLRRGKVMFTRAGEELAIISQAEAVDGFFDYLLRHWHNQGATELFLDDDKNPARRTIDGQGREVVTPVDEAFLEGLGPLPSAFNVKPTNS